MKYPRITGNVYGVVLNDRRSFQAMLPQLSQPPYNTPPKTPILYIKPSNTWALGATEFSTSLNDRSFEIGATIGLTIRECITNVEQDAILPLIDGWFLAADISLPHESYYRPAIREKCQDGSLILGELQPLSSWNDLEVLTLSINLTSSGKKDTRSLQDWIRHPAELLATLSQFMSFHPGDALLLGVPCHFHAVLASVGERVEIVTNQGLSLNFAIQQGD